MALLLGGGNISALPTLTSPSSFLLDGKTKFDLNITYFELTGGTV